MPSTVTFMNGEQILQKISDEYLWLLVGILMVNLYQRRSPFNVDKKRLSTVYIACLAFLFEIFLILILAKSLPTWLIFPSLAIVILLGYILREKVWPYKLYCSKCGKRMNFTEIINIDENTCTDCYYENHPEKKPEEKKEEIPENDDSKATEVSKIDWNNWEYKEDCVITYLFRKNEETGKDQVLLIEKKTGLGSGLINAPGGHIEAGETGIEASIREFKEETGLDILNLKRKGILHFQFLHSTGLRGQVYFCNEFSGILVETDEAKGFWCDVDAIPYDKMWEDDHVWLPTALEGKEITLYSIFEDKKMLDFKLDVKEPELQ